MRGSVRVAVVLGIIVTLGFLLVEAVPEPWHEALVAGFTVAFATIMYLEGKKRNGG